MRGQYAAALRGLLRSFCGILRFALAGCAAAVHEMVRVPPSCHLRVQIHAASVRHHINMLSDVLHIAHGCHKAKCRGHHGNTGLQDQCYLFSVKIPLQTACYGRHVIIEVRLIRHASVKTAAHIDIAKLLQVVLPCQIPRIIRCGRIGGNRSGFGRGMQVQSCDPHPRQRLQPCDNGLQSTVLLAIAETASFRICRNFLRNKACKIHVDTESHIPADFSAHFLQPIQLLRRVQVDQSAVPQHLFENIPVLDGSVVYHPGRGKAQLHHQRIFLCRYHFGPCAAVSEMRQQPRQRVCFHRAGIDAVLSPVFMQCGLQERNVCIQLFFVDFVIRRFQIIPPWVSACSRRYLSSAMFQSSGVSMSCTSLSRRMSGTMSSTSVVRFRKKASVRQA